MISPLTLALQGLQPGSSPIKIATQGFILEITPPAPQPEPDNEETFFVPMTWTAPRIRKDCVITVQGCLATLSATAGNVAAGMPTSAEIDEQMEREESELLYAEILEQEEIQRQQDYLTKWNCVMPRLREHRARKAERKNFQEAVGGFAAQLRGHDDPIEDIAALLVSAFAQTEKLQQQVTELENKLASIAETKKKHSAKRKK